MGAKVTPSSAHVGVHAGLSGLKPLMIVVAPVYDVTPEAERSKRVGSGPPE